MTGSGSLQGDFSRLPQADGDEAILLQQGRVQRDADWNAQALNIAERERRTLRDLVGPHGGPADDAGYAIEPVLAFRFDRADARLAVTREIGDADELRIELTIEADTPGLLLAIGEGDDERLRIAVAGRTLVVSGEGMVAAVDPLSLPPGPVVVVRVYLVDNGCTIRVGDAERAFFLPGAVGSRIGIAVGASVDGAVSFGGWLHALRLTAREHRGAAWRTVHNHHHAPIDPIEPRRLVRDLAVGRGRYYVDGVACENPAPHRFSAQPDRPGAAFDPGPPGTVHIVYLDVWRRAIAAGTGEDGSDETVRLRTVAQVRTLALGPHDDDIDGRWRAFLEAEAVTGRLAARRRTDTRAAPIADLLYRVEVHGIDTDGVAQLKWSRANASIAWPVRPADVGTTTLALGKIRDRAVALRSGDWVELLDNTAVLEGRPGEMLRVVDVDPDTLIVSVDRPVTAATGPRAFIRRWDHAGAAPTVAGPAGRWIDLERGITVRLEGKHPRPGDFWVVPTRSLDGGLIWPDHEGRPAARRPDGARHRHAAIAVLRITKDGCERLDLRRLFGDITCAVDRPAPPPLPTPLPTPLPPPAPVPPHPVLPPGAIILTETTTPPPGFVAVGATVDAWDDSREWTIAARLPCEAFGPTRAVSVSNGAAILSPDGAVYAFDADARSFTPLPTLLRPSGEAVLAAASGALYVTLGRRDDGGVDRSCWRWSAGETAWTAVADCPVALESGSAAGRPAGLVVGGGIRRWWWFAWGTRRSWTYDAAADRWTRGSALPCHERGAALVVEGDALLLAGGACRRFFGWWRPGRYVWRTDAHGRWRRAGSPGTTFSRPSAATWEGRLFIVDSELTADGRIHARSADGRTRGVLPMLPEDRAGWSLAVVADTLFAFGLGDGELLACALTLRRRLHLQRQAGS